MLRKTEGSICRGRYVFNWGGLGRGIFEIFGQKSLRNAYELPFNSWQGRKQDWTALNYAKMIRKQQPHGLLKTTGHFVSMPRHNVNSEELS